MTSGATVFFQIAATLIPAIMFGAILTDKVRPPPAFFEGHARRGAVVAAIVMLGVLLTVAAEIAAIVEALSTGPPDMWAVFLVATVLVSATVGTLGVIAWPWIQWNDIAKSAFLLLIFQASLLGVGYTATTVEFTTPDQTSGVAELTAASNAVEAWRVEGLIPDSVARRDERCLADKELEAAVMLGAANHFGFVDLQGRPVIQSYLPPVEGRLHVPGGLAKLIRDSFASSYCDRIVR